MNTVYIIDALSLLLYCVTIGGILYHRHWLKVNREKVNDISSLTSFDPDFPKSIPLGERRRLETVSMKHAFLPSLLISAALTALLFLVRRLLYPQEAIYRDELFNLRYGIAVFCAVMWIVYWSCYMLMGYSSKPLLQISFFADTRRDSKRGGEFDRCRILRRRWLWLCILITGMWLVIRFLISSYAYMTDTEYVRHGFWKEKHYSYEEIQAIDIEVEFRRSPVRYEGNYVLVLDSGEKVSDQSTSPFYSAPSPERKEMLDFLAGKGIEVRKQELSKDEVAFILAHDGTSFIENIYPEYKEIYRELWEEADEGPGMAEGKKLTVNPGTHRLEEVNYKRSSNWTKLLCMVLAFACTLVVGWLLYNKGRKGSAESLDVFCIRIPFLIEAVGALYMGVAALVAFEMQNPEEAPGFAVLTAILVLIGVLCVVLPLKGVYEIEVEGPEIRVVRLGKVKRAYRFDGIRLCEIRREGIRVFAEGLEKKAFDVGKYMSGYLNFHRRILRDGIPNTVLNN